MNKRTPNISTGLRPCRSPLEIIIPLADRARDLTDCGRAGIRYISAVEVRNANASLKRSAVGNRRWELAQCVRSFRTARRAA